MTNLTNLPSPKTVGNIIQAVSKAQADRYFKTENNSPARTRLVAELIEKEINVALYDAGLPYVVVQKRVEASTAILSALKVRGYKMQEDEPEDDFSYPFGPIEISEEECQHC